MPCESMIDKMTHELEVVLMVGLETGFALLHTVPHMLTTCSI